MPVDANQREAAKSLEQVVDDQRGVVDLTEGGPDFRPEFRSPPGQELKRDGVRGEEGTEP